MTRITIKAKTNARKNEVTETGPNTYQVSVTAPPVEGKANEKIIELLSAHFGKPKRCFTIIRGEHSKEKVIDVI